MAYCGPVCQRADWDRGHKAQCKKLAAERAAEEAAKEAAKGGGGGGGGAVVEVVAAAKCHLMRLSPQL